MPRNISSVVALVPVVARHEPLAEGIDGACYLALALLLHFAQSPQLNLEPVQTNLETLAWWAAVLGFARASVAEQIVGALDAVIGVFHVVDKSLDDEHCLAWLAESRRIGQPFPWIWPEQVGG